MYDLENFILNLAIGLIALWIVHRYWGSFFEKKKNSFLSISICFLYLTFQMLRQRSRGNISLLGTFMHILLILLIAIWGYSCAGKKKYFLLLLFYSVWSLLEEFVFFLLNETEGSHERLDVIGVLISNILMIIFVYMTSRIQTEKNDYIIPNNFYLFLLLIPVGSIYIAINEFYVKNNNLFSMITISILLLFNHNHLDFYRYALHICGKSNLLFIIKSL